MKALFLKELRSLLPMLALMAVFFGGDLVFMPLSTSPDDIAWTDEMPQLEAGEDVGLYGVIVLIFGFVMAYSLFPREHDEHTIELLYAFPVTRGQLFLAKLTAAWATFALGALSEQVAAFVLQWANPQSFVGEQWHPGIALTHFGLVVVTGAIVICHGVLLSFLRRFGLLVYTLLAVAQYQLEKHWPSVALIDPTVLLEPRYDGYRWLVPWKALMLQMAVATVAAGVAYALWMGPAQRVMASYRRATGALAGKLLLGCASAALGILLLTIFSVWSLQQDVPVEGEVEYRSFQTLEQETEHFVFTYPTSLGGPARQVVEQADAAYRQIADQLGTTTIPTVVAELGYRESSVLGLEAGGVVRMAVGNGDFDDQRVLLHETTHAFQSHLGDRGLARAMESTRFFVEGSAEHVAWESLVDAAEQPARRAGSRHLALAAARVHRIDFEDLVDHAEFVGRFAPELYYPLGESWTSALVTVCGATAVGDTLRAMARPDAPQDLSGLVFWQDTLAAIGCDLERVLEAWGELLDRLETASPTLLDRVPRWGGALLDPCPDTAGSATGKVCFRAEADRPPWGLGGNPATWREPTQDPPTEPSTDEIAEILLRVRSGPSVSEEGVQTAWGEVHQDDAGRWVAWITVPRHWLTGPTVEVQVGQPFPGSDWALTEAWRRVEVP